MKEDFIEEQILYHGTKCGYHIHFVIICDNAKIYVLKY